MVYFNRIAQARNDRVESLEQLQKSHFALDASQNSSSVLIRCCACDKGDEERVVVYDWVCNETVMILSIEHYTGT
jgi:hypothetical protein